MLASKIPSETVRATSGDAVNRALDAVRTTLDEPATPRGSRIGLDNVVKRYQVGNTAVTALDHVSLHVDEASFVVILGPSGCGKTTLLNLIGALDTPTTGTVRLDGTDLTHASHRVRQEARRRTVSFVFQTFNLFPALTAMENVQFGADVASRGPMPGRRSGRLFRDRTKATMGDGHGRTREPAGELLERVGLGGRGNHFPHQLSGGEQQRVAIARALATGNPILLADEPTGELDFRTGVSILALLRAQAEAGRTVLVVTHNREIARVADRVVELSGGRVVGDSPPPGGRIPVTELAW
jgi:putative ABC transport system ATP-binding protein